MKTIIFFLLLPYFCFPQWIQSDGPYGGRINSFIKKENKIFTGAAYGGGIFVSTNDGLNWSKANTGLTNMYIQTLLAKDNYIFAGTYEGIYLSSNDGADWIPANNGISNPMISSLIKFNSNIFAGSFGGGVYLSSNNGLSWIEANNGLTEKNVLTLCAGTNNILAGTVSGVFYSSDNGSSWSTLNAGLPSTPVVKSITSKEDSFFCTAGDYVYGLYSIGTGWVSRGSPAPQTNILAVKGNYLFAGTLNEGIFRGTINGNTWFRINNGLKFKEIYSFLVCEEEIFTGTVEGIFLSTNNGNYWSSINNGLTISGIPAMDCFSDNLFLGTALGEIYQSTNNGLNWQISANDLHATYIPKMVIKNNTIYAVTDDNVYCSYDSGSTWEVLYDGLMNLAPPNAVEVSNSKVFVGTARGLMVTTDNGSSWMTLNNGIPENITIFSLGISERNVLAGCEGGVYLSKDEGESWEYLNEINSSIVCFSVQGDTVIAGSSEFNNLNVCIYLSIDKGCSWIPINSGLQNVLGVLSLAVQDNNLFAGLIKKSGVGGYLYRYSNSSMQWEQIKGLPDIVIGSLKIKGDTLFAGTMGSGVWYCRIPDILGTKEFENEKLNFSLFQNYPNPFNSQTIISYKLPADGFIILKIYDILGNEIQTLTHGYEKAGEYNLTFNASGMSSGIYIYKFITDSYTAAKKMILLK